MTEEVERFLGARGLPVGTDPAAFVEAVVAQIVKDFRLDPERVARASIGLVALLADAIGAGLEGDPAPVFAAFYRLDLGEEHVRRILHDHDRVEAARLLAEGAVARAALKVWTRLSYRP